ncbi:hypothetical protein L843_3519 [Mycobacterium intracellulare MIN_061107_1834]|nr:hypothetical protein L843_3519 [Mycobacterium intracellulare MIN_061107_1834]
MCPPPSDKLPGGTRHGRHRYGGTRHGPPSRPLSLGGGQNTHRFASDAWEEDRTVRRRALRRVRARCAAFARVAPRPRAAAPVARRRRPANLTG